MILYGINSLTQIWEKSSWAMSHEPWEKAIPAGVLTTILEQKSCLSWENMESNDLYSYVLLGRAFSFLLLVIWNVTKIWVELINFFDLAILYKLLFPLGFTVNINHHVTSKTSLLSLC